ncbi:MAG: hypothetical protein RL748_2919 [Pseudomonadota bacterium]|jgi:hypothetical protein
METCQNSYCQKPMPPELERCPACGHNNGLPNLRHCNREQGALEARFQAALADCKARHVEAIALDFTQAVEQNARAVINGDAQFLFSFLDNERSLYSAYALQLKGQQRIAAAEANHAERIGVEAQVFGAYGENIRYAALSLNGLGIHSYGNCTITLNDQLCCNIASLTEENTFPLVKRHGKTIPPGYRASWAGRKKLALAKLAARIDSGTTPDQYAGLILFCEGKYQTDQFIEVHLYGPFTCHAIVEANLPTTGKDKQERYALELLEDKFIARGIPCQRH